MTPMSEALAQDDSAARLQAVDPGASVLLEAPAGSGKTAVLTQRFLRLLVTVEDPAQILAITFTRKAAAEMRARVTRALRGQISVHDPAGAQLRQLAQAAVAHGRARGWNIDAEPQSLRIQTIDSFNYWLASQLPVAARVGGRLNVTEAAAPLYQRAARRTLISAEADPALGADTQLLFERFDNHWINLERMLAQMLRERGHWLRFVVDQDAARAVPRGQRQPRRHHARAAVTQRRRCCRQLLAAARAGAAGHGATRRRACRPRAPGSTSRISPWHATTGARRSACAGSGTPLPSLPPAAR